MQTGRKLTTKQEWMNVKQESSKRSVQYTGMRLVRDSTWSLDGLPVFQNANFLMVDLREDLTQGDV